LTEVVRQELDSGILWNAHQLRLQIDAGISGFPALETRRFPDIHPVAGNDLQELLETLHGRYGEDGVVVITRSNKRANLFNQQIRHRILWQEEDFNAGDRLMVVKNNYHWLATQTSLTNTLIANGDTLEVRRVRKRHTLYGQEFVDAELAFTDVPELPPFEARVHLSVLHLEQPSLPSAQLQALYDAVAADYVHLGDKRRIHKAVKEDASYQALQVKFAWAITCHKAQGGQWPAVVVDAGYLTEEMLNTELLRWFYTAFTRAQRELYLLNFPDAFFQEPA
jgi:exodeoxyribonuclease-5